MLIDAGISCRETEKRMKRLGLPVKHVKAIFISHEHTDHISGLESLSNKHNIPVYITKTTLQNCGLSIRKELVHDFSADQRISIGSLTIKAFQKLHDVCDPHSFIIQNDHNVCIGVVTDIGKACEQVIYHFKQCNAVFLEANYDDEMLAEGSYPYFLKKRISGGNGHLSNNAALELFCAQRSNRLTHLILSHLSKNNNCPKLVQQLFENNASGVKMIVASRYQETALYHIQNTEREIVPSRIVASQLSLGEW